MATMNISLPDPMKAWVEAQAGTGRYANASDYVRDLIRRDQERLAKIDELQRLIDDGLAAGVSDRSEEEIRRLGRERLAALRAR
ncbi:MULTISPECIES: type II toxin-antitoxin system ParD family antitoxin [unclassified Methylobacterium]|uniref:type II toxin-antitoxin system ParD family antitoxin n=1 Tax=unclassified Methylobacterium TaxID=2615210 RepID=UPI001354BEC7|nr:type II toxin-antitoxin system ParD family antitoxin [Methylobacterium sp. 2A]MWV25692.1 type II toxin-antitoxin system ParD family antitoxin [Methylobacterium sp. 2A]